MKTKFIFLFLLFVTSFSSNAKNTPFDEYLIRGNNPAAVITYMRVSHDKNYFRGQTNAVFLVLVNSTSSANLSVLLSPDPNFTITRINAPAKWTCNVASKLCTRQDDGSTNVFEFIQVVGTISTNAPTNITNGATLTGGTLVAPLTVTDPAFAYNPSKVVQWGETRLDRQANKPTNLGYNAIASGFTHSLALQNDGSIFQWGATIGSQQLDKPNNNGYLAVAAGSYHSVAIANDGSIVVWGNNLAGQRNNAPTGTGFIAVSCTDVGSVALTNEGKLVAWGNINLTDFPTDNGYVAIATGYEHGIALRFNGTIAQWGANNSGQRNNIPPGGGYKAISCTSYSCNAQRQDGTLQFWGSTSNNPSNGIPTNSVAYFTAHEVGNGSGAMYNDGSVVIWGDGIFKIYSPAPTNSGFAMNSLSLGAGAAALLPMANPTANAGNNQTTLLNTAFANSLEVKLLDNAGNPVSGIDFTFTAPNSGASGQFSNGQNSITVTTDANGIASATFTANNTRGQYNVVASYTGLNPVSFNLTNSFPSPTGTSNPTVCVNSSASLPASCSLGNVVWYDASGTNLQFQGSPFNTPNLATTTTYKVACNNGTIQSDFTTVNVTVVPTRLYVNASATAGANTGTSWANAFTDLQAALTFARSNTCVTEIWVAKGTYKPHASDQNVSFVMLPNVRIYGGFPNTGDPTMTERNWTANPTILSGDLNGNDVITGAGATLSISGNGENSYHVINNYKNGLTTTNSLLDGFTITGGNATGEGLGESGGGMLNFTSSPSLVNLVFSGNTGKYGGGLNNTGSSPSLSNVIFSRNIASGGGMYNVSSSSPTLTNVIFSENNAIMSGGGMLNQYSSPILTNVTFWKNNGGTNSGGMYNVTGGNVTIKNCVFWGNTLLGNATTSRVDIFTFGTTTTISHSLLQLANNNINYVFSGTGNLHAQDPLFINSANPVGADGIFGTNDDGLMLTICSPAIDGGDNTANTATTDLAGNPRIINSTIDVGAYEFQGNLIYDPTAVSISATSVCAGTSVNLQATCVGGTVTWYNASTGGNSIGTGSSFSYTAPVGANQLFYASCKEGMCESFRVETINRLTVSAFPTTPTITPPSQLVVCSPSTLTLTATCATGTVLWSDNSTGTSLTLNSVGTYSISAKCTLNGCDSDQSSITNLEIKAKPSVPTITPPSQLVVCSPTSLTLSATCASGTVLWSDNSTGTSLTLNSVGTYSISAKCVLNGCESDPSTATSLEIKAKPSVPTITPPSQLVVCSPTSLTLTANCTAGTVLWSNNSTGTSLTFNAVGTYSISSKCVLNGCESDPSTATNLEIKAKPSVPTITPPSQLVVCSPTNLTLTANCTTGTVLWSNSATGTSLTLNSVGTYSISAKCVLNGCESDASSTTNLEIKSKPNVPSITPPTNTVVCSPNTLTLTATCASGTVLWSDNSTGTSLTLNSVGTYSISGKCVLNGCDSDASSATNLEIKAKPSVPTITLPSQLVVCSPASLTLTANCTTGTVLWSNNSTGTSLTLNSVGTYSISAKCVLNGCESDASSATNLEIKAKPSVPTITPPSQLVVCSPSNLTLTASCTTGTVLWSNNSTGMSLTLNSVGTYSISAKCVLNGCESDPSSATNLEIKAKPSVPIITPPTNTVVCSPASLTLTATCATGNVLWSNNSTGTSLTLNSVGTYSISAKCVLNGCESDPSSTTSLEIKAKPSVPTITPPSQLVVCSPSNLTLTATCVSGTVLWSDNSTGTSLTLNSVGTYSISAKCVLNGCESVPSSTSNLEIKAKPSVPTITPPSQLVVCSPTTLTLMANCTTGAVLWSNNSTGTSLTLNSVGTYSISAKCVLNGCESDASSTTNLEIKSKPNVPSITPPTNTVVCSPNTLTLTATCASGTVLWSDNSTGTSLTLNSVGTYSISAKCVLNGCESDASSATNLEIKAKPSVPNITPPSQLVVCSPSNLTLTANCASGTVLWSDNSTGTSLTLNSVGTYSISAKCVLNGCESDASSATNLEIKAKPSVPTITPPTNTVVCSPASLTLTATCATGTVLWSNNSTGTSLTLNSVGTYSISAKCVLNGCESDPSSVTNLEIKAKPSVPTITPPSQLVVCSPSNLTLTANCASGTVLWSDNSTGTSLILNSVGTYSISAKCVLNGCESDPSSMTNLEIKAKPSVPTITPPSQLMVCSPSNLTLTANCATGTVLWSNNSTGTSLTLNSVGTYSISAKCVLNGCESDPSSMTNLEIKAKPSVPTITPPSQLMVCSPSNLTLTANCTTGTVLWSNNSTGTSLTLNSVGTYSISAKCTLNGCESDPSSATNLEIKSKPTTPTITPPSQLVVCSPSNLTLTANCATGNIVWSDNSTGTSLTLTAVGTYAISAKCTLNGCDSDQSSITNLEIKAKPATPTITLPSQLVVCFPTSLTLTANCASGTVLWSNNSTGTSLTLNSVGTYSISAKCVLNGCESDLSSVTNLEIKAKPSVPTITPPSQLVVCSPTSLTLTANCTAGTVLWSNNSTGTSLTLNSVGTYSISAKCVLNGCESDPSSATNLEIKAKPSVPTITPPSQLVVCSPASLTLTANCTTGTVLWSNNSTGTSLTLNSVGTYSISAKCVLNGCESDASSATNLEIKAKPSVPTITPPSQLVVCSPASLTLTANCATGTVLWSNNSTGTSLTLNSVGTYSISAKCVLNGCESDPSSATNLEIKAKPSVPIITPLSQLMVCSPSNLTLTANCASGNVVWSNNSTGTSLTLSAVGTYAISAKCVLNGCESDPSSATNLEIKAKPSVPTITSPNQLVVCSPSNLTLTANCASGNVIWSDNSTGTSLTLSAVGTYAISAKCTLNGCDSDQSSATNLEIKAKPSVPTITPPNQLVVCSLSSLTLTANCASGNVVWSDNSTGTSLTLSVVGTYSISAKCVLNGCDSDQSSTTNLEIKAKPSVPTITLPSQLIVCSPSNLTLTANCSSGNVVWFNNSTGTSLTLSAVGTYSISAKCTLNGCDSDQSSVTNLEIKAKPSIPTITPPSQLVVCSPSTLILTASCATGNVVWSDNSTGTSLTLSAVGTHAISAKCTLNGCDSDQSSVTNLEIKAKPSIPTITPPSQLVVCSPSTLILTASCAAGNVVWSDNSTGTSLTLSAVGTYAISAKCTLNGCDSDQSSATNLEIKAKPSVPTITPPSQLVVCSPSNLTLTANCASGNVVWSDNSTGTSLTLSAVGTYAISAKCTLNGCDSDQSSVTNLEIKALPNVTATNTGPYTVGQSVSLVGNGGGTYSWTGPNNFSSTLSSPIIPNALSVNGGIYTLTVVGANGCSAAATTNVVVSGVDPCDPNRIVDYLYVKAGNPHQPLFNLTDGMTINQIPEQVSILVSPSLCPSVIIESFEMNLQGPELNWNILQNVAPNALFDNFGSDIWGRNFKPGSYTLTVTGYAQDNKGGGITYGPKIIRFTVVGNLTTINAPTLSKTTICAGSSVDVSFSTSGTFSTGNEFRVELSDSSGSFGSPVLIGTTNALGTLSCTIPQNTVEGTKYLIRVASSNQVVVSNPAISQVLIHPYSHNLASPANNLTGTKTKKAVTSINASNKVISPASVTYQAGKSILLTPGFESGAVFKAEIRACEN